MYLINAIERMAVATGVLHVIILAYSATKKQQQHH